VPAHEDEYDPTAEFLRWVEEFVIPDEIDLN
jgi:hypothetical protein